MKRVGWFVGAFLAWSGCGSNGANAPLDSGVPIDASVAPDTRAADRAGGVDAAADATTVSDGPGDGGAAGGSDALADALVAGAATWTGIYGDLFANPASPSNCMGSSCHNPGIQKGIDLSTAAKGFTSLQVRIVPGHPDSSSLYTHLASGSMPLGKPRLSDAELARVRAWILAGAPNN